MDTLHEKMSTNLSEVLPPEISLELIKEAVRQVLDERGIYQTPPQPINRREWSSTSSAANNDSKPYQPNEPAKRKA